MTHSIAGISWIVLQVLIGYNLILPIILYLSTIFKRGPKFRSDNSAEADYAVIITAYEQLTHVKAAINSVLRMNYSNYLVYLVADNCDVSGLDINDDRVIVLSPDEPLMSNVKSHFYAINRFVRNHECITIIDSDNLVHSDYLNELNTYFEQGFLAVQGTRAARNLNTAIACLDAARDIYYHFYDGKVLFALGSSATLAGSGMAFKTSLYVRCLEHNPDLNGAGFDKVLQAAIVKRDFQIAFAKKAIVYDAKTVHHQQLVSQRARWINTWFRYFKYGFTLVKDGLVHKSFNQFLFGLILLRPPLFMFLLASAVCFSINMGINPLYARIWAVGFILFIIGFFIALIRSGAGSQIYKSLAKIPVFMFYQVVSIFKSGDLKKNVATRHINAAAVKNINT